MTKLDARLCACRILFGLLLSLPMPVVQAAGLPVYAGVEGARADPGGVISQTLLKAIHARRDLAGAGSPDGQLIVRIGMAPGPDRTVAVGMAWLLDFVEKRSDGATESNPPRFLQLSVGACAPDRLQACADWARAEQVKVDARAKRFLDGIK